MEHVHTNPFAPTVCAMAANTKGGRVKRDEGAILDLLDACAEGTYPIDYLPWPDFNMGDSEYHTMRLLAARARGPDGWGIVIERVAAWYEDSSAVEVFAYGSEIAPGLQMGDERPLDITVSHYPDDDDCIEGVELIGPAGPILLADEMIDRLDLRPRCWCSDDPGEAAFNLMLRAYLAVYPRTYWIEPRRAISVLGLGEDADLLVNSEAFEHVAGSGGGAVGPYSIPPSRSVAYRSLARALVVGSGALFEPGPSNLDWRLHVKDCR